MIDIIVLQKFGSTLYGTATPTSDTDIKGVYIPSAREIILGNSKGSITIQPKKDVEGVKNISGDVDQEIYSLQKFFRLVGEGQTISIDMLFARGPGIFLDSSLEWEEIISNRKRLLSRKPKAFIGYCMQQAKKYGIKGSRLDAIRKTLDYLKQLTAFVNPNSKKLGEFSDVIESFVLVQYNEFIKIVDMEYPSTSSQKGNQRFLEVCGRKLSYTISLAMAISVLQNLFDEYGKRAIQAETNEGIDWKSLSHAVRIAEQAIELFQTEKIIFPRHNANILLDIKQGKVSYNKVASRIEGLLEDVHKASTNSSLPEEPDYQWMEDFIVKTYTGKIKDKYYG